MTFLAEPAGWLVHNPLRFDRSFDDCQELERMGVRAYENGDLRRALVLIDRIRRIGVARADLLCLKADILARLGFAGAAAETLDLALELDPENIHTNSRLLLWSEDTATRVRAAEQLIRLCPDQDRTLAPALKALKQAGSEIVAAGQIVADEFVGWVTWDGADSISLKIRDGRSDETLAVRSERAPDWAEIFIHYGRIHFPLHAARRPLHLSIEFDDISLCKVSSYPTEQQRSHAGPRSTDSVIDADLTVIVPIYNDFEATRDCLDSLRPQLAVAKRTVAVLVNDASPDERIQQLLHQCAKEPIFTVMHNELNLGFAATVNRALSIVPRGDVLVLNADTVLPAGTLAELAIAGRSSPDIGTVTPLSNNGEYTSFPEPFQVNELPTSEAIADIDRAAKVNRGDFVDLPNGIGFCLYVTRRCLDSVGGMPHLYDRGYYEDVEFCLRARENGLRNVCAPWIYVGHAGSRSFGGEKRSLVMRNLKKLKDRFPAYNNESVAFAKSDPLREFRGKIEKELLRTIGFDRLLMAPDDLAGEIATRRAEDLVQQGLAILICIISASARSATIRSPRDGYQSLQFNLGSAGEIDTLVAYISDLDYARFEFCGSSRLMLDVIQRLDTLDKPSDVFIADEASLEPRTWIEGPSKSSRNANRKVSRSAGSPPAGSGRYIAPNDEARAFLATKRISSDRIDVEPDLEVVTKFSVSFSESPTVRCGVVLNEHCPSTFKSFVEVMRRLSGVQNLQFFVLGSTLEDNCLMTLGNVFVLGPTSADEIAALTDIYRLQKLLIYLPQPIFGWSKPQQACRLGLPTARFVWPFAPRVSPGDLRLDAAMPPAVLADQLSSWLVGAGREASDVA